MRKNAPPEPPRDGFAYDTRQGPPDVREPVADARATDDDVDGSEQALAMHGQGRGLEGGRGVGRMAERRGLEVPALPTGERDSGKAYVANYERVSFPSERRS